MEGLGLGDDRLSGGNARERRATSAHEVLAACALMLLRILSYAAKHYKQQRPDKSFQNNRQRSSTTDTSGDGNGIPDEIIAVAGCCLSFVALEIDLAAGPRGAMESVLSLLLPAAGLRVREQAALTLGVIAGQGHQLSSNFQAKLAPAVAAAAAAAAVNTGGFVGRDGITIGASDGDPRETGGIRQKGKRLMLWRRFCAGIVEGTGAQVSEHEIAAAACVWEGNRRQEAFALLPGIRASTQYFT